MGENPIDFRSLKDITFIHKDVEQLDGSHLTDHCLILTVENKSTGGTEVYVLYSKKALGEWLARMRTGLLEESYQALLRIIRDDPDFPPENAQTTLEFCGGSGAFVSSIVATLKLALSDGEDEEDDDDDAPPPASSAN